MKQSVGDQLVKTSCALCVNSCGLEIYVGDNKIVKVKGMADHPYNKGQICPRARAIIDWEYSPDRLTHPIKKENGQWHRISWDEALDSIAVKLDKIAKTYGARSLAIHVGSIGTEDRETTELTQRFCGAHGTPNHLEAGLCYHDTIRARMITFGRFPLEQPESSRCIILWGHNPDNSNPPKATRIRKSIREGSQLIVIDPERIPLAKKGQYFQIRPGTDLALALSMLNVVISEGLYDRDFIEKWTVGFDKLKEHVEQYSPERVSAITAIKANDIREIARNYATNKPACIIQGTCSIGQQRCGFQAARAFSLLQAITGNIYAPGSWVKMPMPHFTRSRIHLDEKPIGAGKYPLYYQLWNRNFGLGHGLSLPEAVIAGKPHYIKALLLIAANPVVYEPESNKFQEAFKKLDLMVVMDLFMNETAKLADIVLPAANFLEKPGLGYSYAVVQGIPFIMARNKVVDPPGECWSEFKFLRQLAKRMGYGKHFPWETEEEFIDYELKDTGLSLEQLRKEQCNGVIFETIIYGDQAYKDNGFPTPSGKIELYSETLAKYGYDPLPIYEEPSHSPVRTPDLAKEYPLILITGRRILEYTHSQMRNIPRLRVKAPEAVADINPETAKQYDIIDGEMVRIETPKGSIAMRLKANDDLAQGVVSIPHGWPDANANRLTDLELRDPVTGFPEFKALLCRLTKV